MNFAVKWRIRILQLQKYILVTCMRFVSYVQVTYTCQKYHRIHVFTQIATYQYMTFTWNPLQTKLLDEYRCWKTRWSITEIETWIWWQKSSETFSHNTYSHNTNFASSRLDLVISTIDLRRCLVFPK